MLRQASTHTATWKDAVLFAKEPSQIPNVPTSPGAHSKVEWITDNRYCDNMHQPTFQVEHQNRCTICNLIVFSTTGTIWHYLQMLWSWSTSTQHQNQKYYGAWIIVDKASIALYHLSLQPFLLWKMQVRRKGRPSIRFIFWNTIAKTWSCCHAALYYDTTLCLLEAS